MRDGFASRYPLERVPDPDKEDPAYVAEVVERMDRERVGGAAPNPLAQALYPPLRPYKPKPKKK